MSVRWWIAPLLAGCIENPVVTMDQEEAPVDAGWPIHEVEPPTSATDPRSCPVPRVEQGEFETVAGHTVVLNGGPSTPGERAEHPRLEFTWVLTEAPANSTTRPVERLGPDPRAPLEDAAEDDPATPEARLYLDVVGTYTAALTVHRGDGQRAPSEACPEVAPVVTIRALAEGGIRVEMSWRTPGDPNEHDPDGSDVDVHLLHPRGDRWSVEPQDCFFANPSPDWGRPEDDRDDPMLDLDDINGAGPEAITLHEVEDTDALGDVYRVGVHYYREEGTVPFTGFGPSHVTIRLYVDRTLAWSNETPKVLARTHDFWEPVDIVWTQAERGVRVVDKTSELHAH